MQLLDSYTILKQIVLILSTLHNVCVGYVILVMSTQVLESQHQNRTDAICSSAYSRSLDLVSPDWLASSGASVRWTTNKKAAINLFDLLFAMHSNLGWGQ